MGNVRNGRDGRDGVRNGVGIAALHGLVTCQQIWMLGRRRTGSFANWNALMSLTDCRLRPHAMHDFEACIPLIAAQHHTGMKHHWHPGHLSDW